MLNITRQVGTKLYGEDPVKLISESKCVQCKTQYDLNNPDPNIFKTPADVKEMSLSGLCPICWEKIFSTDPQE